MMKLEAAIELGKACGLETVEECVCNVQMHAMSLFLYTQMNSELEELQREYEDSPEYEPMPRYIVDCAKCGAMAWHRENECLRCRYLKGVE